MTIAKNILLARPHGFIVSEMRPFLEKAGYAAIKLESLADLETGRERFAGAIISTAVVSSIGTTPAAVYAALRLKHPKAPILFAGRARRGRHLRPTLGAARRATHDSRNVVAAAALLSRRQPGEAGARIRL